MGLYFPRLRLLKYSSPRSPVTSGSYFPQFPSWAVNICIMFVTWNVFKGQDYPSGNNGKKIKEIQGHHPVSKDLFRTKVSVLPILQEPLLAALTWKALILMVYSKHVNKTYVLPERKVKFIAQILRASSTTAGRKEAMLKVGEQDHLKLVVCSHFLSNCVNV